MEIIQPLWPAPANIIAGTTTRRDGSSPGAYASLNLADHVGDDPGRVNENRQRLQRWLVEQQPAGRPEHPEWCWLQQTHSNECVHSDQALSGKVEADAAWSNSPHKVCVVLTADCLPVLLADRHGRAVAAIHAGWRGLRAGVIARCVEQVCQPVTAKQRGTIRPVDLFAWLGPAIGPGQFEVGDDVRSAFLHSDIARENNDLLAAVDAAFTAKAVTQHGKYLCDIYQLATIALNACGVKQVYGGGYCTVTQDEQFFSYRREQKTGRMASFIALTGKPKDDNLV